jgi:hypothetical protein
MLVGFPQVHINSTQNHNKINSQRLFSYTGDKLRSQTVLSNDCAEDPLGFTVWYSGLSKKAAGPAHPIDNALF